MLKKGDIVQGYIRDIKKTHFIVELDNNISGLVHISEISDYYVSKIESMFKPSVKYTFEILEIMNENKVKLSWKSLKPRFQKDPFEFTLKETKNGFEGLLKNTNKEINND